MSSIRKQMKKMRQSLKDRTKKSYDKRDDMGMYRNIFKKDLKKINYWIADNNEHLIDIIPYIAGSHDPECKKGTPTYVLDLQIHKNIGVNEDSFICMARNYNEPCPICDHQKKLRNQGADSDVIKELYPKRRTVYNIIVRDSGKEEKKGVQIYEVAHYFMESHLSKISKSPRGGGFIAFADPDEGKTIAFEKSGAKKSTKFEGHRFIERDEGITDEELNMALTLDDIIELPDYDTLSDIFFGGIKTKEDEEETEVNDEGMGDDVPDHDVPDDEPDDETEPEEEEVDENRIDFDSLGRNELKKLIKDDELDITVMKGWSDEKIRDMIHEAIQSDDEPEEPDSEVDEDEVDEKPEPKEDKKGKKDKCPHGGKYGVDADELDDHCPNCKLYKKCEELSYAL